MPLPYFHQCIITPAGIGACAHRGAGRSAAAKLAVVGQAEAAAAEALLKRMSAAKINSIFTHLRKLAQHPLLVRASYTDAKVAELARLAHQKCASSLEYPTNL